MALSTPSPLSEYIRRFKYATIPLLLDLEQGGVISLEGTA
jgi:hypothetical protein